MHGSHSDSAGVELNKVLERVWLLWVGIFKHPKEVLEEDHLASDGQAISGGGLVCEASEEWVVDELGADEVPPAGFSDVDCLEGVIIAAAAEGRGGAEIAVEGG